MRQKGVLWSTVPTKLSHLGDVPGDGRVVEVIVDVIVHAVGHALEEVGHVLVPSALPGPGGVVERVHPQDLHEHGACTSQADSAFAPPCCWRLAYAAKDVQAYTERFCKTLQTRPPCTRLASPRGRWLSRQRGSSFKTRSPFTPPSLLFDFLGFEMISSWISGVQV